MFNVYVYVFVLFVSTLLCKLVSSNYSSLLLKNMLTGAILLAEFISSSFTAHFYFNFEIFKKGNVFAISEHFIFIEYDRNGSRAYLIICFELRLTNAKD